MNAKMKKQLETVITAIVEEDNETAKKAFHEYLRAKTHSILGESRDEDKDDEDKDDEDKKSDKKANPFAKKDKKSKKDEEDNESCKM